MNILVQLRYIVPPLKIFTKFRTSSPSVFHTPQLLQNTDQRGYVKNKNQRFGNEETQCIASYIKNRHPKSLAPKKYIKLDPAARASPSPRRNLHE